MTARHTQNAVNRTLHQSGYAARIMQGDGWVYFHGPTVNGWLPRDREIGNTDLTSLTPARFVEVFEALKKAHDTGTTVELPGFSFRNGRGLIRQWDTN